MPNKKQSSTDEFANSFKVKGEDLLKEIKKWIHEGNVRKIVIKDEKGQRTFIEIPLTVGVIGTVLLPVLAAVGALAAMVGLVVVELVTDDNASVSKPKSSAKSKKRPTAKKPKAKGKK
jgi:hypothetical protein